jgi:hypothetical protein
MTPPPARPKPRRAHSITRALPGVVALALLAGCSGGHPSPSPGQSQLKPLPTPLPPGFSRAPGANAPPGVASLDVAPAPHLDPRELHKGPLPVRETTQVTQAIVNRAVPTSVRPLLIDVPALRPGERVTIAAGDLGEGAHAALILLDGPSGRFQRALAVKFGVATGVVTLPSRLTAGRYGLAVEDLSGLRFDRRHRPHGHVLLDLAIFDV